MCAARKLCYLTITGNYFSTDRDNLKQWQSQPDFEMLFFTLTDRNEFLRNRTVMIVKIALHGRIKSSVRRTRWANVFATDLK